MTSRVNRSEKRVEKQQQTQGVRAIFHSRGWYMCRMVADNDMVQVVTLRMHFTILSVSPDGHWQCDREDSGGQGGQGMNA